MLTIFLKNNDRVTREQFLLFFIFQMGNVEKWHMLVKMRCAKLKQFGGILLLCNQEKHTLF